MIGLVWCWIQRSRASSGSWSVHVCTERQSNNVRQSSLGERLGAVARRRTSIRSAAARQHCQRYAASHVRAAVGCHRRHGPARRLEPRSAALGGGALQREWFRLCSLRATRVERHCWVSFAAGAVVLAVPHGQHDGRGSVPAQQHEAGAHRLLCWLGTSLRVASNHVYLARTHHWLAYVLFYVWYSFQFKFFCLSYFKLVGFGVILPENVTQNAKMTGYYLL